MLDEETVAAADQVPAAVRAVDELPRSMPARWVLAAVLAAVLGPRHAVHAAVAR